MIIPNKKELLLLFLGDTILFYASLWLVLAARYIEIPSKEILGTHLLPFTILIGVWILSFFIAGLYNKHTLIFRRKIPATIFRTQIINSIIAVLFFYFIPYFSIAPKTNLFLYLLVSFPLISWWRVYGIKLVGTRKKHRAILIGSGDELTNLKNEINKNPRYSLTFVSAINLENKKRYDTEKLGKEIKTKIKKHDISTIVIDVHNKKVEPILLELYSLLFLDVRFISLHKVYEEIFDRIPISLIGYRWVLENVSNRTFSIYDIFKRMMDLLLSSMLGILSLIFYPFVFIAIKLDDKGPIFIHQKRMGKDNAIISIIKFRTMHANDGGKWVVENDPRITRVGSFLRKTRIDELPQLWNVVLGDLSLIGPRPELPDLVRLYEEKIPYYNVRHLIKPGLSGWGQIHHEKPPHSLGETKEKLSYDLYYIKNRSFLLDIEIALKTIKTLLSRSGV